MRDDQLYLHRIIDVGLFFLMAGFLIAFYFIDEKGLFFEKILWLILVFYGAVYFLFLLVTKRPRHLFFGLLLALTGFFSMVVSSSLVPYSINEWWPANGIFFVVSLLSACYYKYGRFKMTYTIPAAIIFAISVTIMFFSFRIATIPFRVAVLLFMPFCWIILICWYFLQKVKMSQKKN